MKKRNALVVCLLFTVATAILYGPIYSPTASATVPGVNRLVSQDSSGNWANSFSDLGGHSISGDGRYVVFSSYASNLVASDTNGRTDVFLRDTQSGITSRISLTDTGQEASLGGNTPSVSYTGQYIVFTSGANLVTGVTGANIYVKDVVNNTLQAVGNGGQPDISSDGRFVAFVTSDSSILGFSSSGLKPVVKDMQTGTYRVLLSSTTNGDAYWPSLNCSGNVVSFVSSSTNLSSVLTYNPYPQNFALYVATLGFNNASVEVASSQLMSTSSFTQPQVSCDGNKIIEPYLHKSKLYNRITKVQTESSVNDSGTASNQTGGGSHVSISDNGRYVAFTAKATNLDSSHVGTYKGSNYDVYVRDTKDNITRLVSFTALGNMSGLVQGPTGSYNAPPIVAISGDGSTVAYTYLTPNSSNPNGELISGVHSGNRDIYISKTGF